MKIASKLEKWNIYRASTDAELVSAYKKALRMRGLSVDVIKHYVSAFRKISSREDRIYFLVSSEDVVDRKEQREHTSVGTPKRSSSR